MPEYKGYGYKRNWKKWAIVYILAAIIVYMIIYLLFFSGIIY